MRSLGTLTSLSQSPKGASGRRKFVGRFGQERGLWGTRKSICFPNSRSTRKYFFHIVKEPRLITSMTGCAFRSFVLDSWAFHATFLRRDFGFPYSRMCVMVCVMKHGFVCSCCFCLSWYTENVQTNSRTHCKAHLKIIVSVCFRSNTNRSQCACRYIVIICLVIAW